MASVFQVEVQGAAEVQTLLKGIPERLYKGAQKAFGKAVFAAHDEVLNNLAGNPLKSRTGALARSMTPEVSGSPLSGLSGRIYSGMIYAPIQEKGGTVVAKNKYMGVPGGPYLNIPTQSNKTAAGVQRMTPQMVFAAGGFVFKRKNGGYGVMLGDTMMFSLVKSVTIKGGLGMVKAADNQIPTLLSDLAAMPLE